MNSRAPLLILAGAAGLLGISVAAAQAPAAPTPFAVPPYKNLKVFPQAITRADLLDNMKFFSQSLGVRCTHCHVGEEGKPLSTFDFGSDAKDEKLVARAMLTMVHKINQEEFGVTKFDDVKVTCYTCHRGSTEPATALPPAAAVPPPPAAQKQERG